MPRSLRLMLGFLTGSDCRRKRYLFGVPNGKQIQVICARPFVVEEDFFYERQQEKL